MPKPGAADGTTLPSFGIDSDYGSNEGLSESFKPGGPYYNPHQNLALAWRQQVTGCLYQNFISFALAPSFGHQVRFTLVNGVEMKEEFKLRFSLLREKLLCDSGGEGLTCGLNFANQGRSVKASCIDGSFTNPNLNLRLLRLGVDIQDHSVGPKRPVDFLQGVTDTLNGDSS